LLVAIAILVWVTAAAAVNVRSKPYYLVGWLWFLGMLLPVSGLIQTGLQSIADRYTYLPAIGLGLMAAWGLEDLPAVRPGDRSARAFLGAAAGLTLIACLCLTSHQLTYWRNTQTLMQHALEIDPNNYVAHQDLARYYSKTGQAELAAFHRQKVRELDPGLSAERPKSKSQLQSQTAPGNL
jgi:hypothetical protein